MAAACSSSAATRSCCFRGRRACGARALGRPCGCGGSCATSGRSRSPAQVNLRMSQGLHTGHVPLLPGGRARIASCSSSVPAWSRTVGDGADADAGEILISPEARRATCRSGVSATRRAKGSCSSASPRSAADEALADEAVVVPPRVRSPSACPSRPRACRRRRRHPRTPPGHGRVRALRRHRRADRARGARGRRRRLDELVIDRAGGRGGAGCRVPRLRRRRRRRQADPDRGRAHDHRRRRGADAARRSGGSSMRPRRSRPDRREPRAGLRGRHRPVVPPHLHGDGRRGEPRRRG